MNFSRFSKEKLLPILVNRTVVFFLLMCFLAFFLYVAGTVQGFTDSTQLILLKLYTFFGIILAAAAAFGAILNLGRVITTKKGRYLLRGAVYVFLVIFATATVLAAIAIVAISGGEQ